MAHKTISYDRERFRKGGIYAVLLPLTLGIALAITIIATREIDSSFYIWPVIFSFILIAPVIGVSSVRELKRRAPFKREEVFNVGLAKASLANFCVAIVYNLILTAFFVAESDGGRAEFMMIITGIFVIGGIIQLILWLVVTAPLTMLCTMIFERIVSPIKTN